MNTTAVAIVLILLAGVGLYIGTTALLSQYSVIPGGSNADQYACAAEATSYKVGQEVRFSSSITEGIPYFWSAPEGTASFVTSGPLTAKYARPGTKTAHLFYVLNNRWYRTSCTVQIK